MPNVAKRMRVVQSPIIPVVGELIRNHPGTISLGQGVVHYGPPREAMDCAAAFGRDVDEHKYTMVAGIDQLLNQIKQKLSTENGIELGDHRRIVVTAGGNMGFMNVVYAITDPGDEIILPRPFYFNHEMATMMANCRPVAVDTDENYKLDVEALSEAITDRTRAIVTVSPNNPSGAVYDEQSLRNVNELCRARGIYHISDEAYEYFTYEGAVHFSPASIPGSEAHTIALYSMSKAYGMASWRVGWMVTPKSLLFSINKAQDTILICPPVICQRAAAAALKVGAYYCRQHLDEFAQVRTQVLEQLDSIGTFCTVPHAQGAFYFLIRLDTKMAAMDIVERLIKDFAVAIIPGTAFGMERGCYLRVAYGALAPATVLEGMVRLVKGLKVIVGGQKEADSKRAQVFH